MTCSFAVKNAILLLLHTTYYFNFVAKVKILIYYTKYSSILVLIRKCPKYNLESTHITKPNIRLRWLFPHDKNDLL